MATIRTIATFATLSISCLPAASFVPALIGPSSTFSSKASPFPLGATPAKTSPHVPAAPTSSADEQEVHPSDHCWAMHALLFSSLTDGILPNNAARSFLRYSLANALLREHIAHRESRLRSSVEFSPCNGPDVDALNSLETVDELYERGQQFSFECFDEANEQKSVDSWSKEVLEQLVSDENSDMNVRVLYIPTASYALNPQSSNTPGKQRQRARADGKKRRTQLLKVLDDLLSLVDDDVPRFNLLATTLDLDDGSLKQPVGSDDTASFPQNDEDALSSWRPHLIYVEGGNTFWLQHCIEKGEYSSMIKDACTGPSGAVYCGKSAGAIVAGRAVATATWKGWDDPSVVPEKGSYEEWLDCRGFEFAGSRSFFPHMSDDWKDLVGEKVEAQNLGNSVSCLREEDVCCVVGNQKMTFVTSGPTPIN